MTTKYKLEENRSEPKEPNRSNDGKARSSYAGTAPVSLDEKSILTDRTVQAVL